ncbi:MAG TPA: bifunctional oligoribonuclease/PAP phosphatase NrnA [Verrucomicrobiae bacterium]|nr:bifunctional oligoribonuclease/PAP phosphatase NrnA [Verrucomicrobiae bacterium]
MTDPCPQIAELLRTQNSFLVLTHYRPDGDAVGSQIALALLLKDLGKQVDAWNDDEVPAKFRFLPGSAIVQRPPAEPKDFDVVIAIDVSAWQRVGGAAEKIRARKHFINIDHHVSNERFADINWIVPDSPASGQITYDLIKRGGFTLTRDIATCLFAAISTDTGSFTYPNTTAKCLRVAAELVETGLNVGDISRHIYESYPYARLQLLQMALADLQLAHDNRVAYYWVTNEMYEESGAKREDTEGLIDYARSIDGVYVAILFEELPELNKVRISLRSKHPNVDVNSIARRFGGGGHHEAAGARITGESHEIEAKVLATVGAALKEAGM